MIVDNKIIKRAKEKLDYRNAEIIADILNVDKYDDRNRKGCCPVHSENTPSFIYNPKSFSFHCFGCGVNIDIIDAYIRTGKSYLEACQELFKEADIDCPINELNVRTKREYRYPHKENPLSDNSVVRNYLHLRGISDKVMEDADINEDNNGNIVFNFYDLNNVLTMVKYRPARKVNKEAGEIKSWCQKDADTSPILFHMSKINPEQPLVITEGEIDCLAVMEIGYYNVVSVPLGSQNLHWIEENFEWLEQFNSIIICGDNDEPGIKMRKEAISRLGSWRCKYVKIPESYVDDKGNKIKIKDANEVLYRMGKEYLRNLINNAEDAEVSSVVNVSEVEDVDISSIGGVETGIAELDKSIMRLFDGTLTIVSGKPGAGKSSFLAQIICSSLEQNITPFIFSGEMPNYLQKSWIYSVMAGPSNMDKHTLNNGTEYYTLNSEAKSEIDKYYNKRWFLYKDGESNKLDDIMTSMENCRRKYGAQLFLLDNLMCIDIGGDANSELKKQTEAISRLIAFAVKWQSAVVLVCHPRKVSSEQEVGLYDLSGTANIINLAHRTLALRRIDQKKESSDYNVKLTILKDRLFGRANKEIDIYYDTPSRRFYTSNDEYNRHYMWEKESKTMTPKDINNDKFENGGAIEEGYGEIF